MASSRVVGRDVFKLTEIVEMGLGIEISVEHLDVYHKLPFDPYAVHLPYANLILTHPNEAVRKRSIHCVKKEMIKAQQKGAKVVVLHIEPGCEIAPRIPLTQKIENFHSAMYELLPFVEDLSLNLALENNGYSKDSFSNPGELLDLIKPLRKKYSKVGFCFDVGHAYIYACEKNIPLQDMFTALRDYIIHVHLHENNGIDDRHAPPTGNFPHPFYRELFSLKGISLTLEINPEFGLEGVKKGYAFIQKIKKEVEQ